MLYFPLVPLKQDKSRKLLIENKMLHVLHLDIDSTITINFIWLMENLSFAVAKLYTFIAIMF